MRLPPISSAIGLSKSKTANLKGMHAPMSSPQKPLAKELPQVVVLEPSKIAQAIQRNIFWRMLFTRQTKNSPTVSGERYIRRESILPFEKTRFVTRYNANGIRKTLYEIDSKTGKRVRKINYHSDGEKLQQVFEYDRVSGKPKFSYDFREDGVTLKNKTEFTDEAVTSTYYWQDGKTPYTVARKDPNTSELISLTINDRSGKTVTLEEYDKIANTSATTHFDNGKPSWRDEYEGRTRRIAAHIMYDKDGKEIDRELFDPTTGQSITKVWAAKTS